MQARDWNTCSFSLLASRAVSFLLTFAGSFNNTAKAGSGPGFLPARIFNMSILELVGPSDAIASTGLVSTVSLLP